jgi:hypothetical protein
LSLLVAGLVVAEMPHRRQAVAVAQADSEREQALASPLALTTPSLSALAARERVAMAMRAAIPYLALLPPQAVDLAQRQIPAIGRVAQAALAVDQAAAAQVVLATLRAYRPHKEITAVPAAMIRRILETQAAVALVQ